MRRTVTIISTVTVRRHNPTPEQAIRDAAMQERIQLLIDDDMRARAKKIEALLNAENSSL